jgi:hypothetical protein
MGWAVENHSKQLVCDLLDAVTSFLHKQDVHRWMQQTETSDVALGFTGRRILFLLHFKIRLDASSFLIFPFFTSFHYSWNIFIMPSTLIMFLCILLSHLFPLIHLLHLYAALQSFLCWQFKLFIDCVDHLLYHTNFSLLLGFPICYAFITVINCWMPTLFNASSKSTFCLHVA